MNTSLGIDTNEKQILFYRENNFWYFNANDKSNPEHHLQIGMKHLHFIKMVILPFLDIVRHMVFIIHQHYIKVAQQHFLVILLVTV